MTLLILHKAGTLYRVFAEFAANGINGLVQFSQALVLVCFKKIVLKGLVLCGAGGGYTQEADRDTVPELVEKSTGCLVNLIGYVGGGGQCLLVRYGGSYDR